MQNVPTGGPGGTPIGDDPVKTGTLPIGTEPTTTTMQPTKFSKLLKVAMPLIQGGLAGGFGGDSRQPGSGFHAAQGMFAQQQLLPLQRQELQEKIRSQRAMEGLEEARTKALGETGQQRTIDRVIDDEVHTFQYNPKTGTYDTDLGPSGKMAESPGGRKVIRDTDAGMMSMDPQSGEATPVKNMAPEETGSLPLPNEPQVAPLHAPQKQVAPQRPIALGEGQELVSPTGKVITPARPKTFAPRAASKTQPKPDAGRVQHYAEEFMQRAGGNADLAIKTMNALKGLPDSDKAAIEKRMREMAKPAVKKDIFQKYGINPNAAPQMPGQPGQ